MSWIEWWSKRPIHSRLWILAALSLVLFYVHGAWCAFGEGGMFAFFVGLLWLVAAIVLCVMGHDSWTAYEKERKARTKR